MVSILQAQCLMGLFGFLEATIFPSSECVTLAHLSNGPKTSQFSTGPRTRDASAQATVTAALPVRPHELAEPMVSY